MTKPTKRNKKLIQPGFQLRLVFSFLALAGIALALQFLLLGYLLTRAASGAEAGSGELIDAVPGMLLMVGTLSLVILLPLILAIGILRTFRIAGPLYRFEKYFQSMAAGEAVGACRLREGDELQSLCDAINAGMERLQSDAGSTAPHSAEAHSSVAA